MTAFWFGDSEADFSPFGNLADKTTNRITPYPRHTKYSDGQDIPAGVGSYRPNPWGLSDVHGNVAEWTRSAYRPYPYDAGVVPRNGENSRSTITRALVAPEEAYGETGQSLITDH